MPSESLLLKSLEPRAAAFRAALAGTLDQVQGALASRRPASAGTHPLAAELGSFADGRIDAGWLASLATSAPSTEAAGGEVLERVLAVLAGVALEVPTVDVPSGGSLRAAVDGAFARAGRAFGASRAFELARAGRFEEAQHGPWLTSLPFARWTQPERRLAPPLLLRVDGADLAAGSLAEFLDGRVKIACVVRGPSTPAPLARLVTPGTFVLQTSLSPTGEAWGLDRFAAHDGPAIAALVPDTAACFVHDPARGASPAERTEVHRAPAGGPRRPVGGWSVWQQGEEARALASWLAVLGVPSTDGAPKPGAARAPDAPADPVNRLAAWLLSQADWKEMDRSAAPAETKRG